ncbi:hypothetical protein ACRS57_21115 [Pseudomonas aeruginosa]|uniref:hypothetical protein n=1 Tax=Pseudomonas aeruginosa TaxID=287 RepID=UPI00071B55E3|nr:hypothetical protein [Pseudomonas aeruginosa]KSQ74691.1 hypothetical protein APB44_17985 [Pseudomonas aeruginosa]RPU90948.1 hypothetical protein IPC877_12375 [Pseudomonas aeruginosa]WCW02744.1 hypothetical protein KK181_02870 [Pseudomonas aeruginosa]SUD10868.1 Uncharacterised protein [Pseudomonas aeruginosa]HCF0147874.1 hypothetical protein [Pseudomonas aeruginosa]
MSYQEVLGQKSIAISISESPDMPVLGLSDEHLRDAMAEIARHLLALGARLIYGGDLRQHGFSELLFELVARHRRDSDAGDSRCGVTNYLAWPVHTLQPIAELEAQIAEFEDSAELVLLRADGSRLPIEERRGLPSKVPTEQEWAEGLTSMRITMMSESDARIVVGGRVENYKGTMPGIAEETLLSLRAGKPIFLVGGFGGCARDIAETLGLVPPRSTSNVAWANRAEFGNFTAADLNNGLTNEENSTLAYSPHIVQVITLILRGMMRIR